MTGPPLIEVGRAGEVTERGRMWCGGMGQTGNAEKAAAGPGMLVTHRGKLSSPPGTQLHMGPHCWWQDTGLGALGVLLGPQETWEAARNTLGLKTPPGHLKLLHQTQTQRWGPRKGHLQKGELIYPRSLPEPLHPSHIYSDL